MGQPFFLSLYDKGQNKYFHQHFLLNKLGEIASNERWYWGYLKDRPLGIGFIGGENERYSRNEIQNYDEKYDYGVAAQSPLFESDCAGELVFPEELPPFSWSGYLVNHTKRLFLNVSDYYDRSRIDKYCLDPLAVLTASNRCASLFFDGFTDGTAYSLLGAWFTDVIEWTDHKPTDMNELCDLEFREPYIKSMYEKFGLTPEGYIADKNGGILFTRKDLGIFHARIDSVRQKYRVTTTDEGYRIRGEFEPDDGVVLFYEGDKVLLKNPDGSAFHDLRDKWYGTACIKAADGNKLPVCC